MSIVRQIKLSVEVWFAVNQWVKGRQERLWKFLVKDEFLYAEIMVQILDESRWNICNQKTPEGLYRMIFLKERQNKNLFWYLISIYTIAQMYIILLLKNFQELICKIRFCMRLRSFKKRNQEDFMILLLEDKISA